MNFPYTTLVLGGNELASCMAIELFRVKIPVVLWVHPHEFYLRHHLCFGEVRRSGQKMIHGFTASLIPEDFMAKPAAKNFFEKIISRIEFLLADRKIPVLANLELQPLIETGHFRIIINTLDNHMVNIPQKETVQLIGLASRHRFTEGYQMLLEDRLNFSLGKIYTGTASVPKLSVDVHFFRSPFQTCTTPIEGVWLALRQIGDSIRYHETLGKINDIEIRSPYDGQIWGLAQSGQMIAAGQEIALIFQGPPTSNYREYHFREKAVAYAAVQAVWQIGQSMVSEQGR